MDRTGHAHHARRPRGMGKEIRRPCRFRRCDRPVCRPLEAAHKDGTMVRTSGRLLRRYNPVFQALLVWLGAGIVENLNLEQLVETARKLKRYEFMLTFAPIPVEGGSGSPVNPIAVF